MKLTVLAMVGCAAVLSAQQPLQSGGSPVQGEAYPAELSVPFGIVTGKLVASGEYLIFIDDQQPGNSFVIPKSELANTRVQSGQLVVNLSTPVRDRSGQRSEVTFRIPEEARAQALAGWLAAPSSAAAQTRPAVRTDEAAPAPAPGPEQVTYQVRHNHLIGGCTGRLIVGGDRLIYESVTELNHSRQWTYQDIRELKRDGPYQVEIRPFVGDGYNMELIGQGMDNAVYSRMVDRIAAARVRR